MELVKMNNRHEDKKRFTICLDALQISLKKITDDALSVFDIFEKGIVKKNS